MERQPGLHREWTVTLWGGTDGQKEKRGDSGEEMQRCQAEGTEEGGQSVLTELFAGFLGHLRHVGQLCKAPGLPACGCSRLTTSRLKGLPPTPLPLSLALSTASSVYF